MSHPELSDLDSLARFWTSRPHPVEVMRHSMDRSEEAREYVTGLSPQLTEGPVGMNFV